MIYGEQLQAPISNAKRSLTWGIIALYL